MTVLLSHPTAFSSKTITLRSLSAKEQDFSSSQARPPRPQMARCSRRAWQTRSTLENVALGVRAAGGVVGDIARLTFFVPGWMPDMAEGLWSGMTRAQESAGYSRPFPPLTLIGVQALWVPELLVEIEATAILS